jgi:hypothetical protein
MRDRIRPHLTFANVCSLTALFVALGGTTYAATGGNFILGHANSAGTPTQLSSNTTNAAGALKVTSTATSGGRAIQGTSTGGGYGVFASGGNRLFHTAAMHAESAAGNAVEGVTTGNPASGVYGQDNNANSYGVAGHSDNGIAVVGDSLNGWAMQALGNTTQTRTRGGFVKAMAYITPSNTSDPVGPCFNSQLSPFGASGPPGNCGINYSHVGTGAYNVNFGFRVDDRFASATDAFSGLIASAVPLGSPPSNIFRVVTVSRTQGPADSPFYIIVF